MAEPVTDPGVRAAFDAYPAEVRDVLTGIRSLIFQVSGETPGAGPLEEALRWGEPAYLAPKGSTIRLGQAKTGEAALFVNCRTSLIEDFRPIAPAGTRFEGTRAVLFGPGDDVDEAALAVLIAHALTYHQRKQRRS